MKNRTKYNLIGLAAAALLVVLDQWTKYLAVLHLKDQAPLVLWKDVFELHYLENRGAAFGMMQGQKGFFVAGTILVLILVAFYYNRLPGAKRFWPLRFVGILLTAGAVGNMIDRVLHSYVVDFFYFKLIDFPIFNVADIYVTVGAALLIVLLLFRYREEELDFLYKKKAEKKAEDGGKEEI